MITPTKHQNLSSNILVIGAELLILLKKNDFTLEDLFQKTKNNFQNNLDSYFDALTFLWLIGAIKIIDRTVTLNR